MSLVLKAPPLPPPQAKDLIQRLLAGGCDCSHEGEARLVRRPVGAAGMHFQIVLQCLNCGCAVGSAQSHAAHPAWESYPLFDESLRRNPYNADCERLAAEASNLLGFTVRADAEIFPIQEPLSTLNMIGCDIGLSEAARRLMATRAWALRERNVLLGLVCEGEPIAVGAIEIRQLQSGYLALIDREMILTLMAAAVQRVTA
jgi:hypothetical protein